MEINKNHVREEFNPNVGVVHQTLESARNPPGSGSLVSFSIRRPLRLLKVKLREMDEGTFVAKGDKAPIFNASHLLNDWGSYSLRLTAANRSFFQTQTYSEVICVQVVTKNADDKARSLGREAIVKQSI